MALVPWLHPAASLTALLALQEHPDVPVVERLQDLWKLGKVAVQQQRQRRRKQQLEREAAATSAASAAGGAELQGLPAAGKSQQGDEQDGGQLAGDAASLNDDPESLLFALD
jgi:hypothetical protein